MTSLNVNQGRNVSTLVAISKNGIIYYEVSARPFNSQKFKDFITQKLFPALQINNQVLIMNNCRIYKTAEVLRPISSGGLSYKFLPPYTPQLNPIEELFSFIKARFKALHASPGGVLNVVAAITGIIERENHCTDTCVNGW